MNVLRYIALWPALLVLAIANAALREGVMIHFFSEFHAQQTSCGTAAVLFFSFTWLVHRRWPLRSRGEAVKVGAAWGAMTIAFEFVMITVLSGEPVEAALAQYDLAGGNLWTLLLVALFFTPLLVRTVQSKG